MDLLSPQQKLPFLDLMQTFHDLCGERGAQYVLCGGSHLGARREKGMIPWDYDLDVSVPLRHLQPLLEVLLELGQTGIYIYDAAHWVSNGTFKVALKEDQAVVLDIFVVGPTAKGRYTGVSPSCRRRWPNWFYDDYEEFISRKLVPFEDRQFFVPKTDRILRRHYGEDCFVRKVFHKPIDVGPEHPQFLKRRCIPVENGKLRPELETISY